MKEFLYRIGTGESVWINLQAVSPGVFNRCRLLKDTPTGEAFVELWGKDTAPQRFDPAITPILIPHFFTKPCSYDTVVKTDCNSIFQQDPFVPASPERHSDRYYPTLFGSSAPKYHPLTSTDLPTTHYLHSDDIHIIRPGCIYLMEGKQVKLQDIIIQEGNSVKLICTDEIRMVYHSPEKRRTIVAFQGSDGTLNYDVFDHDKVQIKYGFITDKQAT